MQRRLFCMFIYESLELKLPLLCWLSRNESEKKAAKKVEALMTPDKDKTFCWHHTVQRKIFCTFVVSRAEATTDALAFPQCMSKLAAEKFKALITPHEAQLLSDVTPSNKRYSVRKVSLNRSRMSKWKVVRNLLRQTSTTAWRLKHDLMRRGQILKTKKIN